MSSYQGSALSAVENTLAAFENRGDADSPKLLLLGEEESARIVHPRRRFSKRRFRVTASTA
jgi:hypothetical protein